MKMDKIIDLIVEESELEEDGVREKVEEKMEEFSGLVSEEGAAHLVAKEHGVQISETANEDLKIDNIVPDMRKVNFKARVVNISSLNTFERDDDEEDGRVQNLLLGDDTGTIQMTLWDEQTEIADKISEDDAIEISGAYTIEDDDGNAEIRLGDNAQVAMADEDEVPEVDEETRQANTTTESSIRDVRSENSSYKVKGMLMAMYTNNPFYRVDPESGDTVRENDDGEFVTDEGKEVEEPNHRLAVSGVIDDGTGNMRAVFFGDTARELLGMSEEEEEDGDMDAVEDGVEEAIGKEIAVEGRTRHNDYFDSLEILVNDIEQIDIEQNIEELLEVLEA
jgi:ssDNA-binding replication factor A large subunit